MQIEEQIKALFMQLSKEAQKRLLDELPNQEYKLEVPSSSKYCFYCNSENIIKHSFYKDTQRYKCKNCKRTFLPTTGTLVYHIKKRDKFAKYASIVEKEGLLTIDKLSKRVGISIPTSFEWRHKILLSLPKKKDKFSEKTQMDDLWFLYSQKGRKGLKFARKRGGSKRRGDNNFQVKILAASDSKHVELKVAKIGRLSTVDIIQSLGDKFRKDTQLITDSHQSYQAFARVSKLLHVKFDAKKHKAETGENVQYINNLAERLKTWINRILRGVSTKYLQLYASYFAYQEKEKMEINRQTGYTKVWDVYTNIERIYEKFIATKSVRTYRCPTKRTWKAQNWNSGNVVQYSFL
ncbi:MAG: IS1595 family transposase [Bacteroidales bacterium]